MSAAEALASLQAEIAALIDERNRLRSALQAIVADAEPISAQMGNDITEYYTVTYEPLIEQARKVLKESGK
tara:strand:- start:1120 stop:1332 length:213 start_codon:yes stop_codon:yes gene_type:complete